MYALLMAVDNHYSSYNTTDQAEVLDEAFTMGRLLRGRPFDEWRHVIHIGLVVHCTYGAGQLRCTVVDTVYD